MGKANIMIIVPRGALKHKAQREEKKLFKKINVCYHYTDININLLKIV